MSAFDTAVIDSKKLTSKPSNDELLELYGALYSQFWSGIYYIILREPR